MVKIENNISLKPFNTFGIDAKARFFARFSSNEDLIKLLEAHKHTEKLIIGGGSNILLTKDLPGIVLKNELKGIVLEKEDDRFYYVKVGGGEIWHQFVLYCIRHHYAGVENLSLIPGCVGTAPLQNIGAYGVELKDVFYSLEAMHTADYSIHHFTNKDCEFGYRESIFKNRLKNQFIILNVTFQLKKYPDLQISYGAIQSELEKMGVKELSIQAISEAVIHIRSSKLPNPKEMGNAGSFFKNPIISEAFFCSIKKEYPDIPAYDLSDHSGKKVAAGWLIEQCGWKGFRENNFGVHVHQALVLVNYGGAKGEDILQLSDKIIRSVHQKFGIPLEREVNII